MYVVLVVYVLVFILSCCSICVITETTEHLMLLVIYANSKIIISMNKKYENNDINY